MHKGEMPQIRNLYMRDGHTTLTMAGVSNWGGSTLASCRIIIRRMVNVRKTGGGMPRSCRERIAATGSASKPQQRTVLSIVLPRPLHTAHTTQAATDPQTAATNHHPLLPSSPPWVSIPARSTRASPPQSLPHTSTGSLSSSSLG